MRRRGVFWALATVVALGLAVYVALMPKSVALPVVTQFMRLGKGRALQAIWSPDGKTLAVASSIGIYLYAGETLEEVRFIDIGRKQIDDIAFSPNGHMLATANGFLGDYAVDIWNADTGQLLHTLKGHTATVTSLTFSLDGRMLATGGRDETVQLWAVNNGQRLFTFKVDIWMKSGAFSPDGYTLAVGGAGTGSTLQFWDVRTGQLLRALEGLEEVSSVAFSRDGHRLVVGGGSIYRGAVQLWDVDTGKLLHEFNSFAYRVAFSPDERTIAAINTGVAQLLDVDSGQYLDTVLLDEHTIKEFGFTPLPDWAALVARGHTSGVSSVSFSPDGHILASGDSSNMIRLWDANNGQLLRTLEGTSRDIVSVAFDPSGHLLASGDEKGNIQLWNVETSQFLRTLTGDTFVEGVVMSATSSIAFSPDGRLLAFDRRDSICEPRSSSEACYVEPGWAGVHLWDTVTGQFIHALDGKKRIITSIAFSPDGHLLAAGVEKEGEVWLWDVATGRLLNTLIAHGSAVFSVAFSPNGHLLASSGLGTVELWDVNSGQLLHALQGHCGCGWVTSTAFSPDGRILASSGADDAIQLWDVNTGQFLLAIEGHMDSVHSLAFSPDGRVLASGSRDGTVRLWSVTWP